MSRIRVVLADDHTLVRAGIRGLLEAIEDVEVVAEASNGHEAVRLTRTFRPDVAVLDIGMKEMDGLQAAASIKHELPQTRVIMLSMHAGNDVVAQALRAGASAYLVKDAAATELEVAVRAVVRGEIYLSPAVSRGVVSGLVQGAAEEKPSDDTLTPRQREILQMIAAGKNTKEIARMLHLSTKTVEAHRAQLMQRLGVRNVANLVMEAVRRGLIAIDTGAK